MKNSLGLIIFSVVVFTFTSCGSTKKIEKQLEQKTTTVEIQVEKNIYPTWIYEGKNDNTGIYVVGSGKLRNIQNAKTIARTNAKVELSKILKNRITDVMQNFEFQSYVNFDKISLQKLTENVLENIDFYIEDAQQIDEFIEEDGTVYILMYLPYEPVVKKLNDEIYASTGNQKELFTESKMQVAY